MPFQRVPELHVAQVSIHQRRTGIDMAEGLLHPMQLGAFVERSGAACMLLELASAPCRLPVVQRDRD